ncbi:MAG: tetratricopeptide repeat protein [Planctomycetota bacterium]
MDKEHRHELKSNELADWITHLPDFALRNWAQITGVILIIIALLVIPIFRRTRSNTAMTLQMEATQLMQEIGQEKAKVVQSQSQGALETQSQLLVVANSLEDAAKKAKKPYAAALALIKRGEALRADLHYQSAQVERSVVLSHIKQAKAAYESAIEKAKGNSTLIGMAQIGLGLCAEEVGDFDGARQIYEAILAGSDFVGTIFPAKAQHRLDFMDDNRAKFVFVEAPQPDMSELGLEMPVDAGPVQPGALDSETPETTTETTAENESETD